MSKIEEISFNLSQGLGNKLNKNDEEVAVLNYGLFVIIHTSISVILTLTVGYFLGLFIQVAIISFCSSMMKRYSGGVHASSPERCSIIGLVLTLTLAYIAQYIANTFEVKEMLIVLIIGFLICYYILYKKCPVPSKNKPLKKESTRMLLRKKAFNLINIYAAVVFVSLYIYILYNIHEVKIISISILLGLSMQVFVLTKVGTNTITKIDELLQGQSLKNK